MFISPLGAAGAVKVEADRGSNVSGQERNMHHWPSMIQNMHADQCLSFCHKELPMQSACLVPRRHHRMLISCLASSVTYQELLMLAHKRHVRLPRDAKGNTCSCTSPVQHAVVHSTAASHLWPGLLIGTNAPVNLQGELPGMVAGVWEAVELKPDTEGRHTGMRHRCGLSAINVHYTLPLGDTLEAPQGRTGSPAG